MNKVPEALRTELAALLAKPESEINFTDIPESVDRKSTRLNSSHRNTSRMPSSA